MKCPFYAFRMIEALLIVIATTSLAYICSMFLATCVPHSTDTTVSQVRCIGI